MPPPPGGAHLLEIKGCDARVLGFVEPEHAGKSLMLAGVRRVGGGCSVELLRSELVAMCGVFGPCSQRLAGLLGEVLL